MNANIRSHVHRADDGNAFVPDPMDRNGAIPDDAESFAEEFIASATAGEPVEMDAADEVIEEEVGGPFVMDQADDEDSDDPTLEPPVAATLQAVQAAQPGRRSSR